MENNIKSNTTFWTEINNYKIQVPYYQRDYAQGRTDGRIDNIRKVFVEELYQAIQGEGQCHLGLVFGSYDTDNSTFIAVDGQQRLTTVFLLHWYVAWKEDKLNDYQKLSTNFSWDTRSYSSQFVELLFQINQTGNVVDSIKTNCNYFSIWENDPTVKGMLTMLEEIEKQYPKDEYGLCQKLFSGDCSIKYDILKLEKNSDGKTYLKMNSRGCPLTTFELFKSKFIDEYKPSFANKFDGTWLNFMLEMSKDDNGNFADPDISYMNFINEYTYMILSLHSNDDSDKEYKHFIDAKIKDNLKDVPFISFEKYKPAFSFENINSFEKFFDWICPNYETIKSIDEELRFPDSKFFADEIIKSYNPHFSHRTKFFSLHKYAELTEYAPIDKELYKRWNRVFRNLVANSEIDGNNFGKICKTINQVANAHIYLYLANGGKLNTFDNDQIVEEIAKAKQILNGGQRTDGKTWEEIIIEAERYAFFKGAIRFLFTKESIGDDWGEDVFNRKWNNAKAYFKEILEPNMSAMNKAFDNAELLKALISRFSPENFWKLLWHNSKAVFNNNDEAWRYYLLNDNIVRPIYQLMVGERNILERKPSQDFAQNIIYQLSNTKLLDFVIQKIPKSWIYQYHGHKAIYPSAKGVFLDSGIRDRVLINDMIMLNNEDKVPGTNFLYGSNIFFQYKQQYYFIYYSNNTVCLMNDNWEGKKLKNQENSDTPENNFYFSVDEKETEESFLHKLDCLIAQAFPDTDKSVCLECKEKICESSSEQ